MFLVFSSKQWRCGICRRVLECRCSQTHVKYGPIEFIAFFWVNFCRGINFGGAHNQKWNISSYHNLNYGNRVVSTAMVLKGMYSSIHWNETQNEIKLDPCLGCLFSSNTNWIWFFFLRLFQIWRVRSAVMSHQSCARYMAENHRSWMEDGNKYFLFNSDNCRDIDKNVKNIFIINMSNIMFELNKFLAFFIEFNSFWFHITNETFAS